ncbi:MAG: ribonuclease P protein component [Candidatus Babeliales bacterium]
MPSFVRSLSQFLPHELRNLFKTAQTTLIENGLTIKLAPKSKEFGRILIVTPRKSGNAVQRNRIRRRLKSIFYQEKLFERGSDCIVFVGAQAPLLAFDDLKNLLLKAFSV